MVSSLSGPDLEAMISTRISRPTLRAASKAVVSLAVCAALRALVVVWMIEAQDLDAVIDRPLDQPAANILTELELKRARTGQLDRPGHPQVLPAPRRTARRGHIVVEQHSEARLSVGDAPRGGEPQAP